MSKKNTKPYALIIVLAGTFGTGVSLAAESGTSGVYVGLNAGRAEAKELCDNVTNCDSADSTVRGEIGYAFSNMLAAELGYTSFGTIFDAKNNAVDAKQDVSAWTLSVLGTWPVAEMFGIFGRIGMAGYNSSNSGTVQGVSVKDDDSTKPYFGAGVKFDLTSNWMLRAEYQRYTDISGVNGENDSVQAWYAGGGYSF